LFSFVVTAADTSTALSTYSINFINEDYAGALSFAFLN
jgi:hypothetical protein